ncbi:MAG: TolC family protein [Gammaproteobacteria bacterium]|nr:TolC family protein [Gammaproteobacteria bacterium]
MSAATIPTDSATVLGPVDAVAIAISDNPSLAAMQARFEAKSAIPSQVGTLPDPIVSLNALNFPTDTFNVGQEAMTQWQFGVSQKLPFPGKLALREEASSFEAEAARNNVDETRLRLIRDVQSSWWTLRYLDYALAIVAKNQVLLDQFVDIARTKYEVGDGLQQDVLLAQLELSKLLDQRIQLTGLRRGEQARLNRLIDRPAETEILLPESTNLTLPQLTGESVLFERAQELRPRLAEIRNKIQAAESRVGLAKKNYYPDFTVGAAYGARQGNNPSNIGGERSDFLSLRFSINLPLYPKRKRAAQVSQRNSEVMVERYALLDERNAVYAQISRASADYVQASEQFSLFDTGIIPQARQTVQSMLAGYQVSEVDFLNLVRSQITLFNYETQYWRSLSAANQALARLRAAVGGEVSREQ